MSVIEVIQDAHELCGFAKPRTVVGNPDTAVALFAALLRVECDELMDYHTWRNLNVEARLQGTGTDKFYTLPDDFNRFPENARFYIGGMQFQTLNSVDADGWTALRAVDGINLGYPYPAFRLFGPMIEFSFAPPAGQEVVFEYCSNCCWSSADLSRRSSRFQLDTDFGLIPESLLTLGIVWRFKDAKGLDYAEPFRTYQIRRDNHVFKDQPRVPVATGYPRSFGQSKTAYPGPLGQP